MRTFQNARNPLLPLDVHTPDSEAHVMPDGKLYLYGSYDDLADMYCSVKYDVVSTSDMKNWSIYEEVFHGSAVPWYHNPDALKYESEDWEEPTEYAKKMREFTDEHDMNFVLTNENDSLPPLLFAPDCIEKNGKYYLYFCMADGSEGVAVSDRPEGPFSDPVRLPCSGIDPAVFVDDDGSAYYYWGQFRSHACKLYPDMISFDLKKVRNHVLTEEKHFFHEGSSMRKIGDTYYAVFADVERRKPTALGYATGTSPLGPFTYRGIIIDNVECDPSSWNNHGSIECFHGQWYVFYHRSSRNTKIFRRLCAEPITIREDGSIPEVKMTSQGAGEPFGPGEKIMGYQACGLTGNLFIDAVNGAKDRPAEALVSIAAGDRAVFRYVKFEASMLNRIGGDMKQQSPDTTGKNVTEFYHVYAGAKGSGRIEIRLNGREAGRLEIRDGQQISDQVQAEPGEYELELIFTKTDQLELDWIIFN